MSAMLPVREAPHDRALRSVASAWRSFRQRAPDVLRFWYAVHAPVIEVACLGVAFGNFITATIFAMIHYSNLDFSSVLTLGGGLQCLGFFCLTLKVRSTGSVDGLSAKSLVLYVLVFCFRLSSTTHKNGYLPVDKTGDWLYQLSDVVSLALVLLLLGRIDRLRTKYAFELDAFPAAALVPLCLLLGAATHGDLNRSKLFDFCWMVGMWLDTVAMGPQLMVLARAGGAVPSLLSHYVAAVFASRVSVFFFWYHGYPEVAPAKGGLNVCGYAIMFATCLQLLLSGDFMFYYLRSVAKNEALVLPECLDV